MKKKEGVKSCGEFTGVESGGESCREGRAPHPREPGDKIG